MVIDTVDEEKLKNDRDYIRQVCSQGLTELKKMSEQ